MAQDFLNFWTPMDRNCLRQIDQSKDRMCTAHRYPILPFFPSQQAAHISNSFEETFTSHKQWHIISGTDQNVQRKEHIRWAISKRQQSILFYLQQLLKVLEICEALSLFPRTLSLQPFPVPCLQGHRAKALGFRVSVWINKPILFKRTLYTHYPVSLYQQQLMFMFTTLPRHR